MHRGVTATILLAASLSLTAPVSTIYAQGLSAMSENGLAARFSGGRIYFDSNPTYFNFSVSVSGPSGYYGRVYSERRAPSFRLADFGDVEDGVYTFEITAATQEVMRQSSREPAGYNGRDASAGQPRVGVSFSGSFRVENGEIRIFDESEQET